jgi:hypothetical protein
MEKAVFQQIANPCKTEMVQAVQAIPRAMAVYHAQLVAEPKDRRLGLRRLIEALYDFYLARSNDDAEFAHHVRNAPGDTVCRDHGMLMARLAAPRWIFTSSEPDIAASLGDALLRRRGYVPKFSHAQWQNEIRQICRQLGLKPNQYSWDDLEEMAIQFAHAIQKHWRWTGVPRPNFMKTWQP